MNVTSGSTVTVKNSILWNNEHTSTGNPEISDYGSALTVTYTDIRQDGYEGNGNIWTDPMFVNQVDWTRAPTTDGDYHLQPDSPLIDRGISDGAPVTDIDGDTRSNNPDLGADEYVP